MIISAYFRKLVRHERVKCKAVPLCSRLSRGKLPPLLLRLLLLLLPLLICGQDAGELRRKPAQFKSLNMFHCIVKQISPCGPVRLDLRGSPVAPHGLIPSSLFVPGRFLQQ